MAIEFSPVDIDVYKAFGSLLGSVGALLYSRPTNMRDMLARLVFSLIAGFALYFVPIEVLGWKEIRDRIIAGSLLMAFLSWFIAGALVKYATAKAKAD
ncbi:hypothetical protein GOZ83_19850 [Agrobacterium vitis]|uniref:hypothetical protein n=1 Tax=Agrobacterium vitis TaxID=373 RepID=UPI0012E95B58|nr:hypothetical protein [Agrobacterium vitis]MVA47311.1 hypothetical protein [Agrobacterium vitis]